MTIEVESQYSSAEFRRWLADAWQPTPEAPTWRERFEQKLEFERQLDEAGWLTLDWERASGGMGLTPRHQAMVYEECARAGAPEIANVAGRIMVAPLLRLFGSEAQRRRLLPGIRDCSDVWCQGFSEPNAGSDLYSLATTLKRDGDSFRLDGQKTWVTYAPRASYSFVLARDAEAQQAGVKVPLTCVLVDMEAAGVEVRPIMKLTGEDDFGEIFLDGVRVTADDVVGNPGQGREIVFALLGFERSVVWLPRYLRMRSRVERLYEELSSSPLAGVAAELRAKSEALVYMATTLLDNPLAGQSSSVVKYYGSRLDSNISELAEHVWSPLYRDDATVRVSEEEQRDWIRTISTSVAAGVDEVQLETVAKLLGFGRGAAKR